MVEGVIITLLALWVIGTAAGESFGGMLWILLVMAAILFIARMLTTRRREA